MKVLAVPNPRHAWRSRKLSLDRRFYTPSPVGIHEATNALAIKTSRIPQKPKFDEESRPPIRIEKPIVLLVTFPSEKRYGSGRLAFLMSGNRLCSIYPRDPAGLSVDFDLLAIVRTSFASSHCARAIE